ncbi:hypothetical protein AMQ83_16250 [Paenibacillus riograndensis]|nr:hypothetical protein AMQ83_16250 [Paenibacillus riograndensis]
MRSRRRTVIILLLGKKGSDQRGYQHNYRREQKRTAVAGIKADHTADQRADNAPGCPGCRHDAERITGLLLWCVGGDHSNGCRHKPRQKPLKDTHNNKNIWIMYEKIDQIERREAEARPDQHGLAPVFVGKRPPVRRYQRTGQEGNAKADPRPDFQMILNTKLVTQKNREERNRDRICRTAKEHPYPKHDQVPLP